MRLARRNRGLILSAMFVVVSVAALGVALTRGAADQEAIAEVGRKNCQQIEALKTEFRTQAIQDFEHLDRNARLLGITLTAEVRKAARAGRDDTLRRFRPHSC